TLAHHGLQLASQRCDPFCRIDDLNDDRNREGRILTGDIVNQAVRAVAQLDGEDRGAGQPGPASRLDHRAVQRKALPFLVGISVKAKKARLAGDDHEPLPLMPRPSASRWNSSTFGEIDGPSWPRVG